MTIFRVIDIETTGIDPNADSVVEIAALDMTETGMSKQPRMSLVFPGRDIPPTASAVHHIVNDDVANAPRAREIVPEILRPDEPAIFVAHNASFESAFLKPYLGDAKFICTFRGALRVFPEAPGHSNQVLRYFLNLGVDRSIADQAHRAFPDVLTTAYLLHALLEKASVEELLAWTLEPPLYPTCPIGKRQGFAGKKWAEVDIGFLRWVVDNVDDPDIIWNAKRELDRRNKAPGEVVATEEQIYAAAHALDQERAKYTSVAKQVLVLANTVEDLTQWFQSEAANRAQWRIVKGDPLYAEIVAACAAHKAKLIEIEQNPFSPRSGELAAS